MGFLTFLNKKMASTRVSKHQTNTQNLICSATQAESVTSNGTHSFRASKHQNKDKHLETKVKEISVTFNETSASSPHKISNVQIIENYVATWNRHASVEEQLQFWSCDKGKVKFEDSATINATNLAIEVRNLYEGLEDIQWNYESIKEAGTHKVVVEGLFVSGTHTADLKFADFPAIPKTGKLVRNDEERLMFTLKHGKIVQMYVISLGNLSGPPGLYMSVGGKLEKPSEN